MEISELRNTITKINNLLDGLNSRMEMVEKRVNELENRAIQIIQSQRQSCGTILKGLTFLSGESQKERRKK